MLRIFTDTAANVPPHLLEQYHITAMPLTYLLDGQPTELVGHDYYEAMRKGAEVKTSLVSPALIRDTMESALKAVSYTHLDVYKRQEESGPD